ncbi:MAG: cbb3-type cytochrome c oxidase subunit II [Planctomycetales bacterium]|nr:cbb3-type cytochrome c oxidase subunit II [Planctomycetales bacterium]
MQSEQDKLADHTKRFCYDDRAARWFLVATAFWGLLASLTAALTTLLLVQPQLTSGVPEIAFGRISPLHINVAIFGLAANALFAAVYYSTQRLCWRPMWSGTLSILHFWGWQLVVMWMIATLALDQSQHRYAAEPVWPIDCAITFVWLIYIVNYLMTVWQRRQKQMYISLWFYSASALAFLPVHVLNNLVIPENGYDSLGVYSGVFDGFMQSWSSENTLMYLVVIPFVGAMYYFFPKITGRPVGNYRLAIVQFWTMIFLGTLSGSRLLHLTSVPEWSSSLGMLAGVALLMPYWAGVLNGYSMLRRPWNVLGADLDVARRSIPFLCLALICYTLISLESGLTAFKSLGAYTIFTDWTLAHTDAVAFGWAGAFAVAFSLWLAPKIFSADVTVDPGAKLQCWTIGLGTILLVGSTYASGLTQGWMASSLDSSGTLVYPEFLEIVRTVTPLWWARLLGAMLLAVGYGVLALALSLAWLTVKEQRKESERLVCVRDDEVLDPPQPPSVLEGAPILQLGIKLDVWSRLAWHRRWERSAIRFTSFIFIVLASGMALQVGAMWAARRPLPNDSTAVAYTPLELCGRAMFVREGCVSCHTQVVRPLLSDTQRYGEYSQPEDYYYDRPSLWGNRRIGPDLAQEGGKQNAFWHWQHLADPREVNPGSVMPDFAHLLEADLDIQEIRSLLIEAKESGIAYDEELVAEHNLTEEDRLAGDVTPLEALVQRQAEEVAADMVVSGGPAAKFDKQAIALIAYLQRLGNAPAPVTADK